MIKILLMLSFTAHADTVVLHHAEAKIVEQRAVAANATGIRKDDLPDGSCRITWTPKIGEPAVLTSDLTTQRADFDRLRVKLDADTITDAEAIALLKLALKQLFRKNLL